ncbi:unnamed protein product, partial [Gulo gulo]
RLTTLFLQERRAPSPPGRWSAWGSEAGSPPRWPFHAEPTRSPRSWSTRPRRGKMGYMNQLVLSGTVPHRSLRITLELPLGGRCENTPVHSMSIVKRLQGPLVSWFWADSEKHQGYNIAPSLQKDINEEIQFIR